MAAIPPPHGTPPPGETLVKEMCGDKWDQFYCVLVKGHSGDHSNTTNHLGEGGWSWPPKRVPAELAPGAANRDPKPGPPAHWFSIDRETMLALAETSAEGDNKYGVDNWRKGVPVSNLINHAMDHLTKAGEGDSSEPHIQHAIWNLGKILWMAKHKPEMVDVPMIRKALKMEDPQP